MQKQRSDSLHPPAKIGIIGGGQLGKMAAIEAKRMGYYVTVLDPGPTSPAGQVADQQIVAGFSDTKALRPIHAGLWYRKTRRQSVDPLPGPLAMWDRDQEPLHNSPSFWLQ